MCSHPVMTSSARPAIAPPASPPRVEHHRQRHMLLVSTQIPNLCCFILSICPYNSCVLCVFSGIAAVLLNLNPNSSSAELLQQLLRHSVKQVINPESLPMNHRLATPNMVVALPDPTSTLTGQSSQGKLYLNDSTLWLAEQHQ